MATPITPAFHPLAYALMLLRSEGLPCVFYGDLYGTQGPHKVPAACDGKLPMLLFSRKLFAYGKQTDYFDSRTCIGWVRHGTWDRVDGCAVLMSVGSASSSKMFVGQDKAGQQWTDVLGSCSKSVMIDSGGFGTFECSAKSVSVWIRHDAAGREHFREVCHADRFRV